MTVEMGGMEGFGLGMEMEQRLRGEEGAERHIFGHSRETGEYSQQRNQVAQKGSPPENGSLCL